MLQYIETKKMFFMTSIASYFFIKSLSNTVRIAAWGCAGAVMLPCVLLHRAVKIENYAKKIIAIAGILYLTRKTIVPAGFVLGASAHVVRSVPWSAILLNRNPIQGYLLCKGISVIAGKYF